MRLRLSTEDLGLFFEPRHHALAERLVSVAAALDPAASSVAAGYEGQHRHHDRASIAELARGLGAVHDLYRLFANPVGSDDKVDTATRLDVRALCLVREALGAVSPLADAIFAVQGLGTYPILVAGSAEQKASLLPRLATGALISSFALTEPEAGSDVGAIQTTARLDGDSYVLDGEKTFISNVPLADLHVVFANADPALGKKGITAFLVERGAPGLSSEPIAMSIDHPIGRLHFRGCRIPAASRLGPVGAGLRVALETLDSFRVTVGAAACGMARRALDETISRVKIRRQFGAALAEQQQVKAYVADSAVELDAARLLVLRAAHLKDTGAGRVSSEVAMAKLYATEAAQRIIDRAVQLHGGLGVTDGSVVERLYREIRPLRIYEGTTEIQRLIIAKELLGEAIPQNAPRSDEPPTRGGRE